MRTSEAGIEQIKAFEGFRTMPYKDTGGRLTVGYGHLIVPGDGLVEGSPITMGQATSILRNDLQAAENCVNSTGTALTQNEFDALVSFVYNLGCPAFQRSTLLRFIKQQNYIAAAEEFPKWDMVDGIHSSSIRNRRLAEQACFQHAIYKG
jgi:lysozyme